MLQIVIEYESSAKLLSIIKEKEKFKEDLQLIYHEEILYRIPTKEAK